MKKILLIVFALFMSLGIFVSCNITSSEPKDVFSSYLDNLEEYSLKGEMTLYKDSNEVKSNVSVDYLKPSYYKVTFSRNNGNEQVLLKNQDGVYVLTPSLNKEFKFNSEWPDNELHVYLVNLLWNKVKESNNTTYSEKNNKITVTSIISTPKYTKIEIVYSSKDKKLESVSLYNDTKKLVMLDVSEFNTSPNLTTNMFNPSLIMNEKTITNDTVNEAKFSISVASVFDDTKLTSSKLTDAETILCYSGVKNYTIIAKKALMTDSLSFTSFSDFDILECGLLLYSKNVSVFYLDDLEVSIYSNSLSIDDLDVIATNIVINE